MVKKEGVLELELNSDCSYSIHFLCDLGQDILTSLWTQMLHL